MSPRRSWTDLPTGLRVERERALLNRVILTAAATAGVDRTEGPLLLALTRRREEWMISQSLKLWIDRLFPVALAGLSLVLVAANPQEKRGIPRKVMDALKAKFPNPEIQRVSKEKEGGTVLYDIEFQQGGNKLEADIREDGTIDNWEKEIPVKDLPAAARKAVDSRYPKGVIKEVMAITVVKDGRDVPEGFEITLESAGKKTVEVTVAPDGRVLEDSGARK